MAFSLTIAGPASTRDGAPPAPRTLHSALTVSVSGGYASVRLYGENLRPSALSVTASPELAELLTTAAAAAAAYRTAYTAEQVRARAVRAAERDNRPVLSEALRSGEQVGADDIPGVTSADLTAAASSAARTATVAHTKLADLMMSPALFERVATHAAATITDSQDEALTLLRGYIEARAAFDTALSIVGRDAASSALLARNRRHDAGKATDGIPRALEDLETFDAAARQAEMAAEFAVQARRSEQLRAELQAADDRRAREAASDEARDARNREAREKDEAARDALVALAASAPTTTRKGK